MANWAEATRQRMMDDQELLKVLLPQLEATFQDGHWESDFQIDDGSYRISFINDTLLIDQSTGFRFRTTEQILNVQFLQVPFEDESRYILTIRGFALMFSRIEDLIRYLLTKTTFSAGIQNSQTFKMSIIDSLTLRAVHPGSTVNEHS